MSSSGRVVRFWLPIRWCLEQEGPRRLAAATDQREQLRLFAADVVLRLERAAPLVAIVSGASRSEPELAELLVGLHGVPTEEPAQG